MNEKRRDKLELLQQQLGDLQEEIVKIKDEEAEAYDRFTNLGRNKMRTGQAQHMKGGIICLDECIDEIGQAMQAIDAAMMKEPELKSKKVGV